MKVMVIGSGGREHAFAWKLAQSPHVDEVVVAPGNAGTALEEKCRNIALKADAIDALLEYACSNDIAFTVVGPEQPLVAGIVDAFQAAGLRIFGPTQAAAQLEGSKAYAKDFLARHQIPTAHYAVHTELDSALSDVREKGTPIVIKADGLAAGKGVVVAMTQQEAEKALHDMLADQSFGQAGARVVIEEFLQGEEASFICLVDGEHVIPLATSQDHKRVSDGDTGLNTGGMGAYSPAPVVTDAVHARVMREIIQPTVKGMQKDGTPFTGFLYAGLMIDDTGAAKVIEFNVRFGDPETQPVLMRLQSDFAHIIKTALDHQLPTLHLNWDPRPCVGVVMASQPYPGTPHTGDVISGLTTHHSSDVKVFHAGTRLENNTVLTSGGRVLCVTALGNSVSDAQRKAYAAVDGIHWTHKFHRNDIAWRAIAREVSQTD